MKESVVDHLTELGFSGAEAAVYVALLQEPKATGYRIARLAGKPVPNTYKALDALHKKGAIIVDETGREFYAVSTDPAGIGYSIFFYEENMAPRKESVRLLAVDGVIPSSASIRSRAYPYTTEVYAVTRDDLPKNSLARQLLDWLRSRGGQALIEDCGYVPLQGE